MAAAVKDKSNLPNKCRNRKAGKTAGEGIGRPLRCAQRAVVLSTPWFSVSPFEVTGWP